MPFAPLPPGLLTLHSVAAGRSEQVDTPCLLAWLGVWRGLASGSNALIRGPQPMDVSVHQPVRRKFNGAFTKVRCRSAAGAAGAAVFSPTT